MPPMRITGAIRAMTAEKSKYQSAASSAARQMPMATFGDSPERIRSQTAIGKASTMATSMLASPSFVHENGVSLPQPLR